MKYNSVIVRAFFRECGLPTPLEEYQFHPDRKWRFDFAFPFEKVALEVDGGIWIGGGHNRGAQLKKTWEKENEANAIGWHIFKCEPKDLCSKSVVEFLKRAMKL